MYALDNVSAIVKDSPDILGVDGACKMGVAVVGTVLFRVPLRRLLGNLQEIVPDEVLGPGELAVGPGLDLGGGLGGHGVEHEIGEVVLQL